MMLSIVLRASRLLDSVKIIARLPGAPETITATMYFRIFLERCKRGISGRCNSFNIVHAVMSRNKLDDAHHPR